MKTFKIILISFLTGAITTCLIVKKYWPTEIKVIGETKYETQYYPEYKYLKERPPISEQTYNDCLDCVASPFEFEKTTEEDYIYITAKDKCKSARIGYKISAKAKPSINFFGGIGINNELKMMYQIGVTKTVVANISVGVSFISNDNKPSGMLLAQLSF